MNGATRVLLVLIGLFIIGRTFSKDSANGETLVDQLLNLGGQSSSSSSSSTTPTQSETLGDSKQNSAAATAAAAATIRKTTGDTGITSMGNRFKVAGA